MNLRNLQQKMASLFVLAFLVLYADAQQDLTLWYRAPADKWTDALPIGNGALGAMIFGGIGQDHLQFNESTLWNGRPRDYQRNGAVQVLPTIKKLLAEGNQKAAEELAEKQFMGVKDVDDLAYTAAKDAWMQKNRKDTSYAVVGFDDHQWKQMVLPTLDGWETEGRDGLDGSLWFRIKFVLPPSMLGKKMKLDLGRIRDLDFTYVNGKLIGSSEGISTKRSYSMDPSVLKEGENTIAVQVINFYDKGGFIGIKENRKIFVIYPAEEGPESGITLGNTWKYFVQNDLTPAVPQYEASYQPFGDLWFTDASAINPSHYKRQLDISNAVATTTYQSGAASFTRTYFASEQANAIVTHFSSSVKGKINIVAGLTAIHRGWQLMQLDDHTIRLSVQPKNGAIKAVALLYVQAPNGKLSVQDHKIILKDADEASFYLTGATNYKNYHDVSADPFARAMASIQKIKASGYQQLLNAHIKAYQTVFNRFSVRFGGAPSALPTDERIKNFSAATDPAFFALYMQYARYLMIACSGANATQPANLQGIWNNLLTPPWGSKYTTNINLQMNYWPAESLNLSDCTKPLFRAMDELSVTGRLTAKQHYGLDGWVLHHNTDLWRGTAPINASNHGIWVTGAAWLTLHIWEHYQFTQDLAFLKAQYGVMRDAAKFYEAFLTKDPITGTFISTPSNSPEQGGLVAGPTMDHQIIRELFRNTIAAARILQTDQDLISKLEQKIPQIAPNRIGRYGQLQEWMKDVDDTANKHRHVSHLWAVFPGKDITWQDSSMMKAARQSLLYRGDDGTGWSLAWKTNLWARFKDGDHSLKMAEKLLSSADQTNGVSEKGGVYKNMFDAHPPFQIDGNFGGAAGLAEMLVQSHMGYIDILPALPHALSSGKISGLIARDGFELEMSWANGKLTSLNIVSKAGKECHIRYGNTDRIFKTEKGKKYHFDQDL